jgi:molybdopterin synthase sulfur carrier subunit
MKILYFSWIRERLGMGEEVVDLPGDIKTVADFLGWLKTRGEEFEAVLEVPEVIRVAINQEHTEHDEAIGDAREIALFPPMTGG